MVNTRYDVSIAALIDAAKDVARIHKCSGSDRYMVFEPYKMSGLFVTIPSDWCKTCESDAIIFCDGYVAALSVLLEKAGIPLPGA